MPEQPSQESAAQVERDIAALREENLALRDKARDLEGDLLRAQERFDVFTSTLPGISWESWGKPHEVPIGYVSPSVESITGYTPEEWQSRPGFWLDIMVPEDRPRVVREIDETYARGDSQGAQEYRWITKDGRTIWVHVRYSVLRDEESRPIAWQAFTLDVTAQKAAEAGRDQMHEQLIQSQAARIAELSAPLIPITEDVVMMPLIGRIDRARADRVIEVLLHGLTKARARIAIVDITGVPEVDAEVASALLRAARATRLLGAEVVITGIRPEVAVAFVELEGQLEDIVTCADVRRGVAYAMRRASGSGRG